MAEPPITFAVLLRNLRTEAGLTQDELAQAAGISARSVSDLERGINLTARKDTARLLANALRLTGLIRAEFEAIARGRAAPDGAGPGEAGGLAQWHGQMAALRTFRSRRLGGNPSNRALGEAVGVSPVTIGRWLAGERLPQDESLVLTVVRAVAGEAAARGVLPGGEAAEVLDEKSWRHVYRAEARRRSAAVSDKSRQIGDPAKLLLRVYIPSERLYAAEAHRLLSLFREWLITARGRRIRQSGYRTASGEMYEFFADDSLAQSDLREEFDSFSGFLALSSKDPAAAADLLTSAGLEPMPLSQS